MANILSHFHKKSLHSWSFKHHKDFPVRQKFNTRTKLNTCYKKTTLQANSTRAKFNAEHKNNPSLPCYQYQTLFTLTFVYNALVALSTANTITPTSANIAHHIFT